jgi:nicotinate dehydrogenase subunit B
MNAAFHSLSPSRRQFLKQTGVLVVSFSLAAPARALLAASPTLVDLGQASAGTLDSWLAVTRDNRVKVYSGKVELGTGVKTALSQIVADELDLPLASIEIIQGDTERTPNQGYTAGSKTIQFGGAQLRQAAATARQALMELAAKRFGVPLERLVSERGLIQVKGQPAKQVAFGELIGGRHFARKVDPQAVVKAPDRYQVVGKAAPRLELPEIALGNFIYVQDVRVPGMLHGRVVRPPNTGAVEVDASVVSIDESRVSGIPGFVRVVRKGNFVGVVAETEWAAIEASRKLTVKWKSRASLPNQDELYDALVKAPSEQRVLTNDGDFAPAFARAAKTLGAEYRWPFQTHTSVGPSCAVADVRNGRARVWTASQGVYQLRGALADLLGLKPERVHVVFVEGSGCYGHNGADDVAADAALLSQAMGRPVRLQWTRADEHGWNPKGPAMVMRVRGGLDEQGRVSAWEYEVWTPTHVTRPGAVGQARNLLAGQLAHDVTPTGPMLGGDRNAVAPYQFLNKRCVVHWINIESSILRPSALRGLGSFANVFANESFVDELAVAAGQDPVQFRLAHLTDPRATDVLNAAAKQAQWEPQRRSTPRLTANGLYAGRGVSYLRYENVNTYVATVADVEVEPKTGAVRVKRVVVAHDCGLIINPNGLRNQIEGAVLQGISRTLKEEVKFDNLGITSLDWASYPIISFPEIPEVEIVLLNRPHEPALGAGEPAIAGVSAALANAICHATGTRLRTGPLNQQRVKSALRADAARVGKSG